MSDPRSPLDPLESVAPTAPTARAGTDTAAPNLPPDQIPRVFGRYRIVDRVGKGGMGAVFRAHDTQLDRVVALKVPFLGDDGAEARQRFYREARAAAALHHPNICPVYDVGEFRGLPYLTMALIDGRGLDRIVKETTVAPPHAAALIRKLALALQTAHDLGIVHRDLKPSNVLIRPNGEPVVMDFGLARRAGDQVSEGITRRGDILGTIEYMSPEQLEGDNDSVGPSADVFALGVVLYEVLTGQRPYTGTAVQIMASVLVKPPPVPSEARPGLPATLDEICTTAMARKPADRFPSMTAFAAALTDFLKGKRTAASAVVTAPAPTPEVVEEVPAENLARPSTPTRPVREAATPPVTRRKEIVVEDEPPASSPSGKKSKKRSVRKKVAPKKTPVGVWIGAGVAAVAVVVVAVIALRPGKPAKTPTVASTDPSPTATAPLTQPPLGTPKVQPRGTPANATPTPDPVTPKTTPAPKSGVGLKLSPAEADMAVGDRREITVEIERRTYRGPLTFEYQAPPELRVSPAGPITVRPDGPNPVLTLTLKSEPTAPLSLAITASIPEGAGTSPPLTMNLPVRATPGPCVRMLEFTGADPINAVAFTPDGSLALVARGRPPVSADPAAPPPKETEVGAIRVIDVARTKGVSAMLGHVAPVTAVTVSADGKAALSVGADDTVVLWDMVNGRRVSQSPKQALRVAAAGMSPDGKRGLVAYPGLIVRIDLEKFLATGLPLKTAQLLGLDTPEAVQAVAVSADRKGIVGGLDGKLVVIEMTDKGKPKPLNGLKEAVRTIVFSPTAGVAATGSGGVLRVGKVQPGKENAVCVWDASAAELAWRSDLHPTPVVSLAFSADGALLASGGEGGEVRVWGAGDGRPVVALDGHTGRIQALAFGPDGKTLLSASADRTVRTWRLP